MLIKQIIEFQLRDPGLLAVHVLQLVNFMTKQKSFKENLRVDYHLLLRYCRRQCAILSPTSTKSLANKILHHNARC